MERAFLVSKESEYYKELMKYVEISEEQREFVKKFCEEKGIEGTEYHLGGNGFVNKPFGEFDKKDISLSIVATENDLNKFGKTLSKPDQYDLRSFRKNSAIAKEFTQRCIDEQIVINLYSPKPRDYFKSLGWQRYSYSQFEYQDKLYIKVTSNCLSAEDTPAGFIEIKLSEFYKLNEERERENSSSN